VDKKLRISLDLDDKAFSSAIKRMQAQLNQAFSGPAMLQQQRAISQKMAQLGLGGLPGSPSDRQLEQSQQRAKQQADRMFEDTRRKFDIIKRLQNDLNKEQSMGTASEQRKLEIKQRLLDLTEKEKRATGELRAQVDRYNAQAQQQNKQFGGRLGAAAGAIGGAGAWIGGQGRLPIEAASAAGSAATSLVGQQLKDMADPSHQAFLPERMKAIEAAKKAWKAGRVEDHMVNAAGTIFAGIGLGLALEAGTLGAATPFLAMAGGGLAAISGSAKQRAITGGNQQAYEQLSAADLADLTQRSITAQEQANPLKKLAAEYNAQNYQRNLGIQRGLGLNDQGFMGKSGFLQGNMAYGGRMQFTEEQVTQQQQAIMAAGGSARMGREAGFGLGLEKNLNMTNAPQLLGGISRSMGGAEQTKEASIRVISEAFKQGLNDSELVDLLRGFTSAAGEAISRSGARSQGDVDRISSQFGKGMLEPTGVGLEAAKTGYESYQKLSGATSGPMSVMQRAAMLRDPILRKLAQGGESGSLVFEKLKQIPQEQLTEDHPAVIEAARMTGRTPSDVIGAVASTVGAGASISKVFGRNKALVDQWRKSNPAMNMNQAPGNIQSAFNMMSLAATTQGVGSANDLTRGQDIRSYGAQFLGTGAQQYGPSEALKTGGKLADQVNANIAAGQQVFVDNFEKFKDSIVPAASNIDDLTRKLVLLGQVAADVAAGKKPAGDLGRAAATLGTQPQADSSSASHGKAGGY
jgi:hypothetical protein